MDATTINRTGITVRCRSSVGRAARTATSASRGQRRLPLLFAAMALTVAAGCGGGMSTDTAESTAGGEATTGATEPTDDQSAASVEVAETSLGPVLVDRNGMTLYLFTADTDGKPTCEGACADLWPAVVDDGPLAGEGVDGSLLGTAERADGSSQVTYAGQPLYRYAQDNEPGDVNGHGVNDVWFAVAPDGTAAEEPPSSGEGYGY